MSQDISARCFSCHRQETWRVEENAIVDRTIVMEGGIRAPVGHLQLAAWAAIKTMRDEGSWRVIEPCHGCGQPFAARQSRQVPMDWPLSIGEITYHVGPDLNTGPKGPIDDDELERLLTDAYQDRFDPKSLVSPTNWFKASLFSVFVAIFLTWLTGVLCLSQFYLAIYHQGLTGS
jgi:hypothetical protein